MRLQTNKPFSPNFLPPNHPSKTRFLQLLCQYFEINISYSLKKRNPTNQARTYRSKTDLRSTWKPGPRMVWPGPWKCQTPTPLSQETNNLGFPFHHFFTSFFLHPPVGNIRKSKQEKRREQNGFKLRRNKLVIFTTEIRANTIRWNRHGVSQQNQSLSLFPSFRLSLAPLTGKQRTPFQSLSLSLAFTEFVDFARV